MQRTHSILFPGLLAAASLCAGAAFAQGSDTITLGAAVSLTGKYSTNGKNTQDGYDLAVKTSTRRAASRSATSTTISRSSTTTTNRPPRAVRSWSSG